MKFGISFVNIGPFADPDAAAAFAIAADGLGFESIWTVEHVVFPARFESRYPYTADGKVPGGDLEAPLPDPLIWLSYVAAVTSQIRLATGVLILPQRNPVVLAKELATLDHLARGRVVLGIGVGWLEEEFEAIGVPFAGRGRRADEYVGSAARAVVAGPGQLRGRVHPVRRVHRPTATSEWGHPDPRRWRQPGGGTSSRPTGRWVPARPGWARRPPHVNRARTSRGERSGAGSGGVGGHRWWRAARIGRRRRGVAAVRPRSDSCPDPRLELLPRPCRGPSSMGG